MAWISSNAYSIFGAVVAALLLASLILYLLNKRKWAKVLYIIAVTLFSLPILFGITLLILYVFNLG